jgi:hypothetical protein
MRYRIKVFGTENRCHIDKSAVRNNIKSPESAIATFAIDDFNNADFAIRFI